MPGATPWATCLRARALTSRTLLPWVWVRSGHWTLWLPAAPPAGAIGKAAILSNGKDTTVGHWEMAGILSLVPFPTYPEGFPARILEPFETAIGRSVLGNYAASGTEIIRELGDEHVKTGKPIVYTSADSVFQIAAHEQVIPLDELYRICGIARAQLDGHDRVARVIARPFIGASGNYRRTGNRRDFAVPPPEPTLLDRLKTAGLEVVTVGKIASIFDHCGVTQDLPAHSNEESMDATLAALARTRAGLIFSNFGDFDTLWGHRNDVAGFARGLEAFDRRLPELSGRRSARLPDSDRGSWLRSRPCRAPIIPGNTRRSWFTAPVSGAGESGDEGSLADIGQTIAENFGLALPNGKSFLTDLV